MSEISEEQGGEKQEVNRVIASPAVRSKRLLLVDGHYYLYRSFFAIRGLKNSRGEPTNAIYGFIKALRRMIADLRPDYAAVVWDAGLPERRTQLQPAYKQHRDEMPDELEVQQEPLQKLVPMLGVASLFLPNTEADDLIASYVIEAVKEGIECVVATNDKDILQLVREGVSIYSTAKADVGEGNGGFKLLGVPEVREKWGVEPWQIGDILALTGDSADNIPGVPGVGGKTAAKWIAEYGSLDRLLSGENLDPKVSQKLAGSLDLVRANREMVALDLDLPLSLPISQMILAPRYSELIEALRSCEFRGLTAEVEREADRMKSELGTVESRVSRVEGDEVEKWKSLGGRVISEAVENQPKNLQHSELGIQESEAGILNPDFGILSASPLPTQGELF